MSSQPTFGSRYCALSSPQEGLGFETEQQRRAPFERVDTLIDGLVLAALHGQRVIVFSQRPHRRSDVRLVLASHEGRDVVSEHFAVERQQQRGAWYVPRSRALDVGVVQLAHWWRVSPRFFMTLSSVERSTPNFDSVDAVAIWAALEPLFEALALPLRLRAGGYLGRLTAEEQRTHWQKTIDPAYLALGSGGDALRAFAPATGWAALDANGVIARRDALLATWAQTDINAARRLRTLRISQLVERYYAKAKDGKARRRVVMNHRDQERTLTAYFGGDWLALLNYLGEEPHDEEEVTRALPETRLIVGFSERAADVATAHGLATEEVERILAAYWNQSEGTSPVEQRVRVLERFWAEFNAIHASQARGMNAPTALITRAFVSGTGKSRDESRFSTELLADIEQLWGTKLLPGWPERLVSEPYSVAAATRAFGPAFEFWQQVAANAWNICEGGSAHSDLEGFERFVGRASRALRGTGHPPDHALFADLRAAESRLGPIEEVSEDVSHESVGFITATMRVGGTTRREGFEILRDIITRHRRAWTEQHLGAYLQDRWRTELQEAGEAYHCHAADRTKPPTVKQFAIMAVVAANNWFGGDLTGVYGALGLRSPLSPPTYSRVLPGDWHEFVSRVRSGLHRMAPETGLSRERKERHRFELNRLAELSLRWVQLSEAMGEPPDIKQFGTSPFEDSSLAPLGHIREAWRSYCKVIQRALAARDKGVDKAEDEGLRTRGEQRIRSGRSLD